MKVLEPTPPQTSDLFNSIWKSRTWLNLTYLFISFPIGLVSFIILITGISLGFGLLITVFGIFILMAVLIYIHWFAGVEARIASLLLGFHISPAKIERKEKGFWKRFKEILKSKLTWAGLIFHFLRFPLGTFSFSIMIGLLSASLGLISIPFVYKAHWFEMDWFNNNRWVIDTFPEALGAALGGIILLYLSLFILNWLAWIYGKLAKEMLNE
jgi:hypothetical protein